MGVIREPVVSDILMETAYGAVEAQGPRPLSPSQTWTIPDLEKSLKRPITLEDLSRVVELLEAAGEPG